MHHQLSNQEVARLRHAELLRASSRRNVLDEDAPVSAPRANPVALLAARVRSVFVHVPIGAPALRSSAR